MSIGPHRCRQGFTLLEVLVVLVIIGLLAVALAPSFSSAIERARVTRVKLELHQIEIALTLYHDEVGRYPPVRVSCNTDERDHWCQLPVELVEDGYLPAGANGVSSAMLDPFNRGRTYKYAAIGPYMLNGDLQEEYFPMFIPDDFPVCQSQNGAYLDDAQAPLDWVVWSLGPRQKRSKALHARAPAAGFTWYRRAGDNGVIARIKPKNGGSFQTP